MVTNGTIQYKTTTGGGIDGNGDPIPVTESWSDPVDCLFKQNSNGKKMKYQDGEFVASIYDIDIQTENFASSTIRLFDIAGKPLGEFQVLPQNIYHYALIVRTKITV